MLPASTPGISFPSNLPLEPYKKPRQNATPRSSNAGRSVLSASEVLLHTSAHPKLDYEGREEDAGEAEPLLKHYVGVYDPVSGELQLVQARKLVVRSTLRSSKVVEAAAEEEDKPPTVCCPSIIRSSFPLIDPPLECICPHRTRPSLRHQEIPKGDPFPHRKRHPSLSYQILTSLPWQISARSSCICNSGINGYLDKQDAYTRRNAEHG